MPVPWAQIKDARVHRSPRDRHYWEGAVRPPPTTDPECRRPKTEEVSVMERMGRSDLFDLHLHLDLIPPPRRSRLFYAYGPRWAQQWGGTQSSMPSDSHMPTASSRSWFPLLNTPTHADEVRGHPCHFKGANPTTSWASVVLLHYLLWQFGHLQHALHEQTHLTAHASRHFFEGKYTL